MSEVKPFGLVDLPGGWKKTIDETNDVVKAHQDKFPEATLEIAIGFATESLQNAINLAVEQNLDQNFEEVYSNAKKEAINKLKA